MNKPSPPPSPDYNQIAQQQGQNQIDLAKLTNPNVVSPYGTQTYYSSTTDKNAYQSNLENQLKNLQGQVWDFNNSDWRMANGVMSGPNASERAATIFTNHNQDIQNQIAQAQQALDQFNKTGLVPSDTSRPTIVQTFSPEQQALYDKQTKIQGLLGDLGIQGANAMSGIVGTPINFGNLPPMPADSQALRNQMIDAAMSRVNQDYGRQKEDMNSNLVAAGIHPGSKAYDNQANLLDRGVNDARQQAILNAGTAAQQAYGMDMASRQQALSEQLTKRQAPLNEITALLSGSQVSNPFQMPNFNPTMPGGTPYMQGAQLGQQNNIDLYNLAATNAANTNSGLFGLGTAGLMAAGSYFSDRRLKSNVTRIGTHDLGIGIYEYDIFGRRAVGVMADEVERVKPEAVSRHESGYAMVDYGRL